MLQPPPYSDSPEQDGGDDLRILSEKASENAKLAVEADKNGEIDFAFYRYIDAIEALQLMILHINNSGGRSSSQNVQVVDNLMKQIDQYLSRAEQLKATMLQPAVIKTEDERVTEHVRSLLTEAMDEDEAKNVDKALELYTEVLDYTGELMEERRERNELSADFSQNLKKLVKIAFERERDLKEEKLGFDKTASPSHSRPVGSNGGGGGSAFTDEELRVLSLTSKINTHLYVPFMPQDISQRFSSRERFKDPDGPLTISEKMRRQFTKWVRPSDVMSKPQMIIQISPFSLKQTVVPNCSFVSALTVCANYENRWKKQLITSIIYPQKNKIPIYNPSGKYMVKLFFNGCRRKVIIDDLLPYSHELMCATSTNRNELWVSIVEKAFLKVMGGYNFPGSNSSADLYVLTGWIPERYNIKDPTLSSDKSPEEFFDMILKYFKNGNCLINFGTGALTEPQEKSLGLVTQHGYACLNMVNYKGQRMALLKNPWAHTGWKGAYSKDDSVNWTKELKVALNFDPHSVKYVDNGVFWISFNDMKKHFDSCSVSWNPDFFPYRQIFHRTWSYDEGPKKQSYSLAKNPQYVLTIEVQTQATVWLLLSKHITQKSDFADNHIYMGLEVFKKGGKKMYYSEKPLLQSVQSNAMNTLVKLRENTKGVHKYTIVVCQYEKNENLHYTLKVFSIVPIVAMKEIHPLPHTQQLTGQWDHTNCGGPYGDKTNPSYKVEISNSDVKCALVCELKANKSFGVFVLVENISVHHRKTDIFKEMYPARGAQREYRSGYFVFDEVIQSGVYKLTLSTYQKDLTGPYILDIHSSLPLKVTPSTSTSRPK